MKATHIPAVLTVLLAGLLPVPSRGEGVVVQWEQVYNGPGNGLDGPSAVAVDSAGNVIVTGPSDGSSGNSDISDIYTAKYAAGDGSLLWDRRYDGPGLADVPDGLALDSAGNVIVTGYSTSDTNVFADIYTAKYAATNGALLWEKRYNGPVNGSDTGNAVAVDSAGNVIVTGEVSAYRVGGSYYSDYYTAKYAAANGALLWQKFYNATGIATDEDYAYIVAIDKTDNVIVAGHTWRLGSDFFAVPVGNNIVKYSAADGALLWSAPLDDGISSLAVDDNGNVFVSSSATDSDGLKTIHTAKYAAANGALIWDEQYESPNDTDSVYPVVVDNDGNATVTSVSLGSGGDGISWIHRVSYAAADGGLIWEKHYPAAVSRIADLEVDYTGNMIVTGWSVGSAGNEDVHSAKYAAADGALLWEKRYNGPSNLNDSGTALALDSAAGIIVTGRINKGNDDDFYTVKYVPVDLDLDDDGLLDSWETEHFGSIAAHGALDDSDGDGAVELLEFAFGTDPKSPTSVPAPAVVDEGGYLTTTITKQSCVRYLVETGGTLESGFSAASTTVLTDTATTLKVRDNVLTGTQPARFLRVQVTAPP